MSSCCRAGSLVVEASRRAPLLGCGGAERTERSGSVVATLPQEPGRCNIGVVQSEALKKEPVWLPCLPDISVRIRASGVGHASGGGAGGHRQGPAGKAVWSLLTTPSSHMFAAHAGVKTEPAQLRFPGSGSCWFRRQRACLRTERFFFTPLEDLWIFGQSLPQRYAAEPTATGGGVLVCTQTKTFQRATDPLLVDSTSSLR